jgi:hypothetical protein
MYLPCLQSDLYSIDMLKAPEDSLLNDMEIGFRFMTIDQYTRKLSASSIDSVCSSCLNIWKSEARIDDLLSDSCQASAKIDRLLLDAFDTSGLSNFDHPVGVVSVCDGIEEKLQTLPLNYSFCRIVKAGIHDPLDVDEWQRIVNEATGSTFLPHLLRFISENQPKVSAIISICYHTDVDFIG